MLLLGLDIGSSSIKASLVDGRTGRAVAVVRSPATELEITAARPGWAEQDPEIWWKNCCRATRLALKRAAAKPGDVAAIGISYQMHGLVAVDKKGLPVRPSIIWCDSRAVEIGEKAFREICPAHCLEHLLNPPGNFTASKLAWVKTHEPSLFDKIEQAMLPGDFIALRMTGEAATTVGGLSEGVFWDFMENKPSGRLMEHFGFSEDILPPLAPTFGIQGRLTKKAATALGLSPGTPVSYRSGDQPNNALSLNVLRPGEAAATGGTSGVIYAVADRPVFDEKGRVNSFAHVSHSPEKPRIGLLLCINGAGIAFSWLRSVIGKIPFSEMEKLAAAAPAGSDGLRLLPFGNGAERILLNKNPGARLENLHFNRHDRRHLCRAALEGIAFSFAHGARAFREMGVDLSAVRAGNDNLFQSPVFSSTVAALLGCPIEVLKTTGATGAAIAAGAGIGHWEIGDGLRGLERAGVLEPVSGEKEAVFDGFGDWEERLAAYGQ